MDKKERLDELIEYYSKGNKSHFAKMLGVKAQTINTWLTRNTYDIELIFAKCKDVNAKWLLTGCGDMIEHSNCESSVNTSATNNKLPIATKCDNPNEGIPLLPIDAMAGAFTGEQQVLEYECERYVVPAFKGADFLIPVKGVSMHPRFSSGDIVACKRLSMDNVFFQWNKVYVIDTVQGPLIKRLKPGSDKDHVLVVSDNTAYDPFELAIGNIYHLALVIGVIRLE